MIKKLNEIQQNLKAPKGQFNSFGKYAYRSCEDILNAVKPFLGDAVLTLSDELVLIGDRYYVHSTAELRDDEGVIGCHAYAREEQDKKGMDASQITGSASSYARKYALNGLFLIDDTKDADTMDNNKEAKKPEPPRQDKPSPTPKTKSQQFDDFFNAKLKPLKDSDVYREKLNEYLTLQSQTEGINVLELKETAADYPAIWLNFCDWGKSQKK